MCGKDGPGKFYKTVNKKDIPFLFGIHIDLPCKLVGYNDIKQAPSSPSQHLAKPITQIESLHSANLPYKTVKKGLICINGEMMVWEVEYPPIPNIVVFEISFSD